MRTDVKSHGTRVNLKVYTLNLLSSNLQYSLTKTESSTMRTRYWHIDLGGGTFLLLLFKPILATFRIVKARDNSGKELAISDEYENLGLVK